jgi:mRNA-degrading endonuclease toxin of MazEF toxin-antitoxin module
MHIRDYEGDRSVPALDPRHGRGHTTVCVCSATTTDGRTILPTCGSLSMICHLALSPMACAAVAESFSSIRTVRSTRLPLPMVLVHGQKMCMNMRKRRKKKWYEKENEEVHEEEEVAM